MADTIILHRTPRVWMAEFKDDEHVRRLFGTTRVPTPFLAHVPANKVLVAIRLQNEGATVRIAGHPGDCPGCADTNEAHQ